MMVEHSPSRLQGNPSPCLRCPGGPTFRNLHAVEDDEQTGAIGSNLDHGGHLLGHGLLLSLPSRVYGRQPDPAKAGALDARRLQRTARRWTTPQLPRDPYPQCLPLAQSRHAQRADECPLLGAKQTWINRCLPISILWVHGLSIHLTHSRPFCCCRCVHQSHSATPNPCPLTSEPQRRDSIFVA